MLKLNMLELFMATIFQRKHVQFFSAHKMRTHVFPKENEMLPASTKKIEENC